MSLKTIERRKAQARPFIERAPGAPVYGSEEYLRLPDGHPAKVAAVYKAAEAWLTEAEDAMQQLYDQAMGRAMEVKRSEDAEYVQDRDEWRQTWSRRSWRPHPANRQTKAGGATWDVPSELATTAPAS